MTQRDDCAGRVKTWLMGQGYPFEMRVASIFQKAGFQVLQSDFYLDAAGKPREIDVVASIERTFKEVRVRLTLIIECKRSKDAPWVLLCTNNKLVPPAMRVMIQPASHLGHEFLGRYKADPEFQKSDIFTSGGHFAYGLIRAHKNEGNEAAYEAITSLTGALTARIDKANLAPGLAACCEVFVPILATEARLFECGLDEDNELQLEPILAGTVILRKPFLNLPMTIAEVITAEHLKDFAEKLQAASTPVLKKMDQFIHEETPKVALVQPGETKNRLFHAIRRRQMKLALTQRGLLPDLAEKGKLGS